jgi:hypothetical protein
MKSYVQGLMAVAIVLFSQVLHAWNDAGHMLVSTFAFEQLSPKLRTKYLNILKQHPRFREDFVELKQARFKERNLDENDAWIFALAATWPDLSRHFGHVKDAKERDRLVDKYTRGRWHYVNHPLYMSPKDKVALNIKAPVLGIKPAPALLEMNIVQALAFVELKIRNRHLPVADKAVYLCWWLHLMGDLHQPLHNVALFATRRFSTGDRGGNSIRVGKKRNLHSVWDGALTRALDDWQVLTNNKSIDSRVKIHTRDGESNYVGWSEKSAQVAKNKIYTKAVLEVIRKRGRLQKPTESQNKLRASIALDQASLAAKRMSLLLAEF